jgi:hypothetical protein
MAGAEKGSRSRLEILFLVIIGLLSICILLALASFFNFGKSGGNKCDFPEPIPGLTYDEIADHVAKIGVSCNPMEFDGITQSASCRWESENGQSAIDVYIDGGEQPEDIILVMGAVTQVTTEPSDDYSRRILGYIATLPYDNAEPLNAKGWISMNLSGSKSELTTRFGGVKFQLPCSGATMRCLAIGENINWDSECQSLE